MAKITDFSKAFEAKIQALYDIEHQVVKALPKMVKGATNPMLKKSFELHLGETKDHIVRLEKIFKILGAKPKKLACEGIRGIIADGEWVMKEVDAPEVVQDAMLAGAVRYVEHYEMAGYMAAIDEAKSLGLPDVLTLLMQTHDEEKAADKELASTAKMLMRQG
ncbi:MAG TPA: DUF892 family protein [Candidatus Paceibacterota bacterium]|nr:DUF892 family protein [Candidatus Paceibacterota bacterium]